MIPAPVHRAITQHECMLTAPYCLTFGGYAFTIRAGFVWDGASIPRAFWRLGHPLEGHVQGPALCHDAAYASEWVRRADADRMLYDMLRLSGVCWAKARTYWLAVRVGGWAVWRQHTPESVTAARQYVTILPVEVSP
jgi:hypothetical protein